MWKKSGKIKGGLICRFHSEIELKYAYIAGFEILQSCVFSCFPVEFTVFSFFLTENTLSPP